MEILNKKIKIEDFQISSELDRNNPSFIYGEVCHIDLSILINKLEILDRTFLDIGSGCGKIVIYLAYKFNLFIDGIEIDKDRYQKSLELLESFNLYNNITFFNNDFREIYLGNYDVIYCCNLVFSKEDNNELFKKIIREFNGIIILFYFNHLIKKYLIKTEKIKTSWNREENIYIFKIY